MSTDIAEKRLKGVGRVLIADDDAAQRNLLRVLAEKAGHHVIEAADGEQALKLAMSERPDVVLLDVMMPGLNGFEVCRQLKADPGTAPIPVLLVTSLADREDRIDGMRAGADDFLTKPVCGEEVSLRIRNAVYTKQLFDELEEKYRKLRDMADLRDRLTRMILDDTEALAGLMVSTGKHAAGERTQDMATQDGTKD